VSTSYLSSDAAEQAAEFDEFAEDYESALAKGLRYSGEGSEYFAKARIQHVARRVSAHGLSAENVLDFGCGTGSSSPLLKESLGATSVLGVDASPRLVARARRSFPEPEFEFSVADDAEPEGFDLAYCNGVFHHIEPGDRIDALSLVRRALRPGGLFALWENNPLNPGTRLVMRAIPFDAEAKPIFPWAGRRMLQQAGFQVLRIDYAFFFPRVLRMFRPLERPLGRLPVGAQYMVLARRPRSDCAADLS
jgi:SAM-dependent methyltransferase